MNRRRAIAVLSLLGLLDSSYLLLHKLGYVGSLACTAGATCNIVNTSEYSTFLGLPVALYGMLGYLTILGLTLYGLSPDRVDDSRIDQAISALSGLGLAFSLYLSYLSLFVIGAACPWCIFSLLLILLIFVLSSRGAWGYRPN